MAELEPPTESHETALAPRELPGPPVARGGSLLGAARGMLRDPIAFILQATREHGPLVRIPLGPRTLTVIAHPDDLQQVLQQGFGTYERGRVVDVMRLVMGNALPMSDGEVWRRKRRIMQPAFNRSRLKHLVHKMAAVTARYVERFDEGEQLDASDLMMRLTRDVIVETMFSGELGEDTAELDKALADLEHYVARYAFVPFLVPLWLPTPDNRTLRAALATLHELIDGLVAARRASGERHEDLLDALLDARDEESGEPMPADEIRDELITIFFAGHETTANALTWTTYLLSTHPEELARVRDEVDRVLGDRAPTAADVEQLGYTTAVLRESMRLYPPGWVFGRVAARDDVLRGHQIRKGDLLAIVPLVTHRMAEHWPEPERFDPERFVGDRGGHRDFTYVPFGCGPHMCIGTHFATMEAVVVLAMIARRGQLVVERPHEVRMKSTVTLHVDGGLPVRFEGRDGGAQ
ncbi:MAG: cytochrome P450 [Myxococcales bacterium]|nr:cytochrome P450 [Myxococcales bacterium]